MKKTWLIFSLHVLALTACGMQIGRANPIFECPDIIPALEDMPEFLDGVYPVGRISKAEFDSIIVDVREPELHEMGGIRFQISKQGIYGDRSTSIANEISLRIDGMIVSDDDVLIGDGMMPSGPFYYNWPVDLDIGYHSTTLVFDLYSGETINYEWKFCIVP